MSITNRLRRSLRFLLLVCIAVAVVFVGQRAYLKQYAGTEPIAISTQPAPATYERAFPNLVFKRPVFVTYPPDGTNRIAVISQLGSMYLFPNDPAVEEPSEVLNIQNRVTYKDGSNEEGLLGLAFHPNFRANRQFFIYYTNLEHINVLARFTMSAENANLADPNSELELLRTPARNSWNHNGGSLLFGPDGYLYLSVGDGGPVGDPHNNAQNLATVFGKILRIDIDHEQSPRHYAIPNDNPFVNVPGARPEIWAYGLRNVWRMAFDCQTHRLWAGDVGDDTWEEIDVITRGGNYGWRINEGFRAFSGKPPPESAASFPQAANAAQTTIQSTATETFVSAPGTGKLIDPVFAYKHSVGNCIIGGCVYRGHQVPALAGAYLFADHVTGRLYALRYDENSNAAISVEPIEPISMPVFSFGEDEAGEVYFTTTQGVINRIVAASPKKSFAPRREDTIEPGEQAP